MLRVVCWRRGAALCVALSLRATVRPAGAQSNKVGPSTAGPSDTELASALDGATVLRAAVARNPAIAATRQRAAAMQLEAKSEGSLPPPEIMAQVWQVPISRPYALNTQMIMVGVTQSIPAPGSLGAREEAMRARAAAEMAMSDDRSRQIVRDAGHAFADYVESTSRHGIHLAHLAITRHLLELADARYASGGSLADAAKALVESSRLDADIVRDAALVRSARARINALLDRQPGSALGPPVAPEPGLPAWDTRTLLAQAHERRPELKAAQSQRRADELTLRAAKREATWPSFNVGALYFPATDINPYQGYGASASMSLPWLWGGASDRRAAQEQYLKAATTDVDATRLPIDAEVVTAQTTAESAALRLMVLRDRTLVATHRAFDVAQSGYESGRADLLAVLDARRSVVDVEHDIVMARSELAHALVDLNAAVGAWVPTKPLPVLDAHSPLPGADHVN